MCPTGEAANEALDHVHQLHAAHPAFYQGLRVGVVGDGRGVGADDDASSTFQNQEPVFRDWIIIDLVPIIEHVAIAV